ncbi:glycosyltransferase family 39 protein [Mycolicibacterium sp.]|uniref:glycosyltransferase family 39 protein n=1 Tax=Mycolicibacterium sp. TaxID=2320850 RepID=UPI001A320DE7|nr:glycosyltransferase family 39 protein [Mycolicibacterium sp.]MBJ7339794.1 glycosyltransferase family 39 protein [Mycolicibacterium sp.]
MLETSAPTADVALREPEPQRTAIVAGDRLRLGILLAATAVLYLWNVTINGMGNQYYAAAVQAGSRDWEALLFGSLDANNFITVDKPPLSQWVMGLSGQLFGFSSASMLIPQALMAVAAVGLLYGAVRRISGPGAGLLAGAALALTPVAVLMFRFNDPDAAMVLLMTAAAYCTVRALERGSARWLAGAGAALGFAFLAKMLEGAMVMPALVAAYLVAAPVRFRVRVLHLVGAAAAFALSAGWFVVLTLVWPASARPYLAGSTDNTFMNLVLGYNGLARVLGRNHSTIGLPPGMANLGGVGSRSQGWNRLLSGEFGFEIGWLVPAALLATVVTVAARGRTPRTDLGRAGAVLFGGWFLVDGLVLSYMHGTIHPYYTLSIAPPVAAIFAIGVHQAWARRSSLRWRIALVCTLTAAGGWAWWLLRGSALSAPALRWPILLVTALASVALLWSWGAHGRRVAPVLLAAALVGALGGPAAYAVATVSSPHQGIGPSVGPPGTGYAGGKTVGDPKLDALLEATDTPWSAAIDRSTSAAGLELATGTAVMAIGGFSGTDPTPTLQQFQDDVARHRIAYYLAPRGSSHGAVAEDVKGEDVSPRAHSDILRWVRGHFHSTTVGGITAYELFAPKAVGATGPGGAAASRR